MLRLLENTHFPLAASEVPRVTAPVLSCAFRLPSLVLSVLPGPSANLICSCRVELDSTGHHSVVSSETADGPAAAGTCAHANCQNRPSLHL